MADTASQKRRTASTPPPTTRFVGDLNPEASMIAEAQSEQAPRRDRHSLGIWLENETGHAHRDSPIGNTSKENGSHTMARTPLTSNSQASPLSGVLLPGLSDQK